MLLTLLIIATVLSVCVTGYAANVTWHMRRARQECSCGSYKRHEQQSLASMPLSIIDKTPARPIAKRWDMSAIAQLEQPATLSDDEK